MDPNVQPSTPDQHRILKFLNLVFDSALDTFTLGQLLEFRRLCSWFSNGPNSMEYFIRQVRYVELPYDVLTRDLFAENEPETLDEWDLYKTKLAEGNLKYQRVIEELPVLCPKIEKLKFTELFTELRNFGEDEFANLSQLHFCFEVQLFSCVDHVQPFLENMASFSRHDWLKVLHLPWESEDGTDETYEQAVMNLMNKNRKSLRTFTWPYQFTPKTADVDFQHFLQQFQNMKL